MPEAERCAGCLCIRKRCARVLCAEHGSSCTPDERGAVCAISGLAWTSYPRPRTAHCDARDGSRPDQPSAGVEVARPDSPLTTISECTTLTATERVHAVSHATDPLD